MRTVKTIEVGTVFGRWTVVNRVPKPEGIKKDGAYFLCRCACGRKSVVTASNLRSERSKQCGVCGVAGLKARVHGHTTANGKNHRSPTCGAWMAMKQRCLNPKHNAYKYYGGRGIEVCDLWINDFEKFLADMGERPLGGTIDRKDPDGNYTPYNCHWATPTEQNSNLRIRRVDAQGVRVSQASS